MALRALFLDVGNTLLRERPSRFELYAQAAHEEGCPISTEEMAAQMRRAHAELPTWVGGAFRYTDPWFEAYIARIFHESLGVPRERLSPLSERLFARFSDPATFELYPGAFELLALARTRGLRVGIISNWSHRLPGLLERLDISPRVDFVLCSALERLEKPSVELYRRALQQAGVQPEEALHAGDDIGKDLLGAQQAGLRAVLVDHARAHANISPAVSGLDQLAEIVDRLTT